jgi:hypothetical protein
MGYSRSMPDHDPRATEAPGPGSRAPAPLQGLMPGGQFRPGAPDLEGKGAGSLPAMPLATFLGYIGAVPPAVGPATPGNPTVAPQGSTAPATPPSAAQSSGDDS